MLEKKVENIIFCIVLIVTKFFRWNLKHFAYITPHMLKIDLDGLRDFSPITGIVAIMSVYFIIGILIEKYKFDLRLRTLLLLFVAGGNWLVLEHVLFIKSGNMYDLVFDSYSSTATIISTTAFFLMVNKLDNRNVEKLRIIDKFVKAVGTNTLTVYYAHFIIGCTILKDIDHGACTNSNVW